MTIWGGKFEVFARMFPTRIDLNRIGTDGLSDTKTGTRVLTIET